MKFKWTWIVYVIYYLCFVLPLFAFTAWLAGGFFAMAHASDSLEVAGLYWLFGFCCACVGVSWTSYCIIDGKYEGIF